MSREISLVKDSAFLNKLDLENIKTFYVKILVLDNNEIPIRAIEGRTLAGSITISASSSVRRAGSITFLAESQENDLTDIDNLLAMNKKIKILLGFENHIDKNYDDIIWFKLGIFVITNPSLTHSSNGVAITLQFKDKMCLLNGENGGNLPTSITFDHYDQVIGLQKGLNAYPIAPNDYTVYEVNGSYYMWDKTEGWKESSLNAVGEVVSIEQRIFDIIQTLVCNYGGEGISHIQINDVPLELRQIVRYTGSDKLYYNTATSVYTLDTDTVNSNEGTWISYGYNEDCGYVYTDFVYPNDKNGLVSAIGDNVCSVLDKIISVLGNFEYFYDIDGNFVFQEKKNYLNTQYDPVQTADRVYTLSKGGLILSAKDYYVDFSNTSSSIYSFEEGSTLINSYTNTPSYTNIKNDFHIWGKNQDASVIHYHIAVKSKPEEPFSTWKVVAETDEDGEYTGKIHLATGTEVGYDYVPADWRAELYLQGMQKKALQQRPDIYEQELLDLFDIIYDMRAKSFKTETVDHPNDLLYWFDYINPSELFDISVDVVGSKIYSYQQDNIKRLYNSEVPNVVIVNSAATPQTQMSIIEKCEEIGQSYSRVSENVYKNLSIGTAGYTAQEVARTLLYQYTDFNSAVSISSIPIYYLDVNNRITVKDRGSGINGDYVVNSITVPLDAKNAMSISATKALRRD